MQNLELKISILKKIGAKLNFKQPEFFCRNYAASVEKLQLSTF